MLQILLSIKKMKLLQINPRGFFEPFKTETSKTNPQEMRPQNKTILPK